MNFKNSMKKYSSFCNFRNFFIKVQKIMLEFCDVNYFRNISRIYFPIENVSFRMLSQSLVVFQNITSLQPFVGLPVGLFIKQILLGIQIKVWIAYTI